MPDILSPEEETFCQEYVRNGNIEKHAAKAAWPALKNPENKGNRLMAKPEILTRIKEIRLHLTSRYQMFTTEQIIDKVQNLVDDPKMYPNIKIQGLTLLAKIRGLLVDRHEISANPRRIIVRDSDGVPMDDFKPEEKILTERDILIGGNNEETGN